MHLYLDANVLVDVALKRIDEKGNPLWVASTLLLDEIYKGKNRGSISALSLYVVYVLVKPKGHQKRGPRSKEKTEEL